MKLTVLMDNNTLIDSYLTGEPGVSYFIELDDKKYLFDTGYSAAFIGNAQTLGLDLRQLQSIILSHGHNDHTWGLGHLIQHYDRINHVAEEKIRLIAHPQAFLPKHFENKAIGGNFPADCYSSYVTKIESAEPYQVAERLIFLGEIPRSNHIEAQSPIGETIDCCGRSTADFVLDDSALVYIAKEGIVVITGCSHSGICNIIDYAIQLTGKRRVLAVIGGFHLLNAKLQVMQHTARYFAKLDAVALYPCHCTDLQAKVVLSQVANVQEVGVGMVLNFD